MSPFVKTRHRLRNRCHDSTKHNTTLHIAPHYTQHQCHRCQPQHHNTSPPPRQTASLTTLTCAIHFKGQILHCSVHVSQVKKRGQNRNKLSLLSNLLIREWMKKSTHPSNPLFVIGLNPYNGT